MAQRPKIVRWMRSVVIIVFLQEHHEKVSVKTYIIGACESGIILLVFQLVGLSLTLTLLCRDRSISMKNGHDAMFMFGLGQ